MKQHRPFTLTPSQSCSETGENMSPMNMGLAKSIPGTRTITTIAAIISILYLFLPAARAQRVKLDIPLTVYPMETNVTIPSNTTIPPKEAIHPRIIGGIVSDSTGAPLPGIVIMLLPISEKIGAVTNEEGEFSMEIPNTYAKDSVLLKVTSVGFVPQHLRLSLLQENDHIEVYLPWDHRSLGCPVINAYKPQEANRKMNQDPIGTPVLIKLPDSESSTTK